ncbi:ammonium transporter [Chondromyces apiculatus]|uniref:Ammonium transporter n=1 Tax=Chondromyces apiculatus DSM 436 TaxID=1192034 RepID=A0A017SYR8_9BACT|nr:ammonium transporter [Chondromyces apiculatus]EYF02114.1 Ammonium transporter [Chondromyces apiculatus DSM 436]
MQIDSGDTAWLLVSTALVLFMTPGLALFYGGMVRRKNVLSTLMHAFAALGVISLQWILFGYSLAFGRSHGGLIGGMDHLGLAGLTGVARGTVPALAFCAFQMMFAVITPALIAGAFAERMRFSAYLIFAVLWSTLVYDPVAHWVWAEEGWLFKMGALDFAGGTVVHLAAGISALVCAVVIGRRTGWPHERHQPHNLTMTLLGAGVLWFGWFGFNAGSALSSGGLASMALVDTHAAAAAGACGWVAVEWAQRRKPTALGAASGLVAGLVGITPAAGFVSPLAAVVIGFLAGAVCYAAVLLKERLRYDDSLDAFGVHGVGGLLGALLTGVFAQKALNEAGQDGLLAGNPGQLVPQLASIAAVGVYAGLVTLALLKLIDKVVGLRVPTPEEREGLDATEHGETGYAL